MTKRILSAEISHETNTFSVLRTSLDDYLLRQCYFGEEIAERMAGTRTEIAAHIDAAKRFGWELVPTVAAHATPSGKTTVDAWAALSGQVLAGCDGGQIDGVLLALHGAQVTEDADDAEGDLIARLRDRLGPDVPITLTLDLHANVTDDMARLANVIIPFRTYPHIDQYEVATEAAEFLARIFAGEIKPRTVVARRDTLDGCNHGRTQSGPMADLLKRAAEIKAEDAGVLNIGVSAGFAWSDIAQAGPSVTVTGDGDDPRFLAIAEDLMDEVWQTRSINTVALLGLDDVAARITAANASPPNGPLVIGDTTDNPGGGGYGDGVRLLEKMLEMGAQNAGLAALYDPQAADACHAAGIGGLVAISLGARVDPSSYGPPLEASGTVEALSADGAFICEGPMWAGMEVRLGRSAVLRIDDVRVVISSNNLQVTDCQAFRLFDIDPATLSVAAVKSSHHFRAAYEPIASEVVLMDSGGLVSTDYKRFDYQKLRRPIWPLDTI
jgi:microcystin degradation protein MlrC